MFAAESNEFSDQGDRVIVTGRFQGQNKNGAELDTRFEHVFATQGGKVAPFENKPDDVEAWAVGWGAWRRDSTEALILAAASPAGRCVVHVVRPSL